MQGDVTQFQGHGDLHRFLRTRRSLSGTATGVPGLLNGGRVYAAGPLANFRRERLFNYGNWKWSIEERFNRGRAKEEDILWHLEVAGWPTVQVVIRLTAGLKISQFNIIPSTEWILLTYFICLGRCFRRFARSSVETSWYSISHVIVSDCLSYLVLYK